MKNKSNIFWGIIMLILALIIVLDALGINLFFGVGVFGIILTCIMVGFIVRAIIKLDFGMVLFPLAIIGIIFKKPLGLENISSWTFLLVAFLGTIGLGLIFGKKKKNYSYERNENFKKIIDMPDDNNVDLRNSFSGTIKYVNTDDLQSVRLSNKFGGMKVYFENAKIVGESANLYFDSSFGGVELYIPREWRVINNVNVSFGDVEEKNRSISDVGPILYLSGNVSFGGITIIYV